MDFGEFTKQKLTCVRDEIARLRASDFPHVHAKECLALIDGIFKDKVAQCEGIDTNTDAIVKQAICLDANTAITRFHNLLGFILRSTNVRNAFELYDPVLRLAKKLLGQEAKLILSSEWDFSPFTFAQVFPELPNFVFIGLPASESSNPLIIPLAGHELGHTVWRTKGIGDSLQGEVQKAVLTYFSSHWSDFESAFGKNDLSKILTDMFLISSWTPSFQLSLRQCEEIFCDCLGIRLFGASYLYSFEYLVAPNLGPGRDFMYPPIYKRAEYMIQAAQEMHFNIPSNYAAKFVEPGVSIQQKADRFIVNASDGATEKLVPSLIKTAVSYCDDLKLPAPTVEGRDELVRSFKSIVPTAFPTTLADIANAGWTAFLDANFWSEELVPARQKFDVLTNLILKTIEVLEFETKIRAT